FQPIVVRRGANVQDCAVVHVNGAQGVEVGPGATVGHNCTVHAAWLGEECLVGNGSTVLDGARIGVRAMVAGGALVTPETDVPDGMLAMGTPAKVKGPLAGGVLGEGQSAGLPGPRPAPPRRHKTGGSLATQRPRKLGARFSLKAAT